MTGWPTASLLRSPVLEEAERWIALRPRTAPMPNVEIQAFIAASRSATLRHRDFLAASLTVGLLVALGLAGLFYWQRSTAENATKLTKKALYTTEQLANKLVLKFGNDPRLFSLPPELREEIFDQAILSYNSVLKLDPMNAETYNDRGNAYFAKAEFEGAAAYDQAIADYGDAIALDPKNVRAYSNRCWIGVVVARQLQRALSDCDEALRIEPQYLNALDNRGFAYLKLERVDDAIKSFDAALKIDPKFPTSLYGRGLAKMKNGDRESAAVDMKAAIAIKSNVADVLARYSIKVSGPISAGNNGNAIVNNMIDSDNYSGTRN